MFDYARSDTHFLLYIFDRMRNLLLERGNGQREFVESVLQKSEKTCLRTYLKELYDPLGSGKNGWANLLQRWHTSLNDLQQSVFKSVHKWRDEAAREEDESPRYILSNNLLFLLASQPPADAVSLKNTLKRTTLPLQNRLSGLLSAIRKGVTLGLSANSAQLLQDMPTETTIDGRVNSVKAVGVVDLATRESLFSKTHENPIYYTPCSKLLEMKTMLQSKFPNNFDAILQEIHNSIRIAPSVPQGDSKLLGAPPTIESESSKGTEVATAQPATETRVVQELDLAFIPASQRESARAELHDQLVTVGKPNRKRKRQQNSKNVSKKTKVNADEELEEEMVDSRGDPAPFEYDGTINILDLNTAVVKGTSEDRTKKKKDTIRYGNFPAPPRNLSEVKGGNISRSFK